MAIQVSGEQAVGARAGRWREGGGEGHVPQDRISETVAGPEGDGEGAAARLLHHPKQGKHLNQLMLNSRSRFGSGSGSGAD